MKSSCGDVIPACDLAVFLLLSLVFLSPFVFFLFFEFAFFDSSEAAASAAATASSSTSKFKFLLTILSSFTFVLSPFFLDVGRGVGVTFFRFLPLPPSLMVAPPLFLQLLPPCFVLPLGRLFVSFFFLVFSSKQNSSCAHASSKQSNTALWQTSHTHFSDKESVVAASILALFSLLFAMPSLVDDLWEGLLLFRRLLLFLLLRQLFFLLAVRLVVGGGVTKMAVLAPMS
mmetsp:Transcript_18678/g.21483  ORF Transcript_18678/g.21483 Transcript_18678/m.21483 type:complete len:229 (+) Transcript_18678:135-821(+)